MGLDMYLDGKKFVWTDWKVPENNPREDGFEVKERVLRLGYWRKHPNLHGYIVETFAGGVDECQDIDMTLENLEQTLAAVKADDLPHTQGFFFGESLPEDKEPSIKILEDAINWLKDGKTDEKHSRSVTYHASW